MWPELVEGPSTGSGRIGGRWMNSAIVGWIGSESRTSVSEAGVTTRSDNDKDSFRQKNSVQTLGWGWAIATELFRLLRKITLWSHSRGIENTCLDRAHEGRCGRLLRRALRASQFRRR
jgi:hypothetical protein